MENPSKYGVEDPRELEIAYTPDRKSITLTQEMTGHSEVQNLETETDGHKYYPVIYEGKVYIVSDSVTKNDVALGGETGYKNGPKALQKHAEIYGNEKITSKGETWNEATIGILDILPKFLRRIEERYWTEIQWPGYCAFGLQRVYSSGVHFNYLYYYFSGSMRSDTYSGAVRPLVSLISNIQVDIEKLDGTPLSLRLPTEQSEEQMAIKSEDTTTVQTDLLKQLEANMSEMSRRIQQLTAQLQETAQLIEQIKTQNLT
jgi:hypothetical protein